MHNDLLPNSETENEALKADYKAVTNTLRTDIVIGSDQLSVYRTEETNETLQKMEQEGPVIISGSHGAGKSSLLRLMEGQVKAQGRPTLYLSTDTLGEKRTETVDDLVATLKKKNGLLLVDEFTYAFMTQDGWDKTAELRELMEKAAQADIPLALVVHAYPEYRDAALQRLPFTDASRIVIPRGITSDEIRKAMSSGATYKRTEKPRNPQVLEINEDAVKAVAALAGDRPAVVNYFLQRLYTEEQRKNPLPAILTATTVNEYFKKDKKNVIASSTMQRVMKVGLTLLENPQQEETFIDMFLSNPDEIDHATMTMEDVKDADADALDAATKKAWMDAGLIKEQNGRVSVNGFLTAMVVTKHVIF